MKLKRINKIHLNDFKGIKNFYFDLDNLTIISGKHNSGKSAFIDSLMLFRDNSFYNENDKIINSEYNISLYFDNILLKYFMNEDNGRLVCDKHPIPRLNIFPYHFKHLKSYNLYNIEFYWEELKELLENKKNQDILFENLKHKNSKSNNIIENLSLWFSDIIGDFSIELFLEEKNKFDILIKDKHTNELKNIHEFGFSVKHILCILTFLLISEENDLIIIEYPETFLTPESQGKLGYLFSLASSNLSQIILKTNSEHIVNGIRIAVKNKSVKEETINFYHFVKDSFSRSVNVYKNILDKNARFENIMVEGFFDYYEKQLDQLL